MNNEELKTKRKEILGEMIELLNKKPKSSSPHYCYTGILIQYDLMKRDCLKKYEELSPLYDMEKIKKVYGMSDNISKILTDLKEKLSLPSWSLCPGYHQKISLTICQWLLDWENKIARIC